MGDTFQNRPFSLDNFSDVNRTKLETAEKESETRLVVTKNKLN